MSSLLPNCFAVQIWSNLVVKSEEGRGFTCQSSALRFPSSHHSYLKIPAGKFPLDVLVTCLGLSWLCGISFVFFFSSLKVHLKLISNPFIPSLLPPCFLYLYSLEGITFITPSADIIFFVKVKDMLPDDGRRMSVLFLISIHFPLGCVDCPSAAFAFSFYVKRCYSKLLLFAII